ncbi:MAG: hypothetical protein ABUL62_04050 [Myxococcales bacterium]
MNRLPALKSLGALVAQVVILLQVVGALHFSLVRHSYSAALGGVVHVHAASFAKPEARAVPRTHRSRAPSVTSDTPSCSTDLCAAANAPQSVAPHFDAPDVGAVVFGEARLLNEPRAASCASRRVLLGAPKTSPPV